MATTVDGLVSGMSTTQVIDQLMQAEARTQTSLRTRVTQRNRQIEGYQSVNTKFNALLKATSSLVSGNGLQQAKATSSSQTVAATAKPGALPGSLSFTVNRLARAEVHVSNTVTSTDAMVTTGGPVTINGREVTLADGRLSTVVSAINARDDLGVRAAAVKVAEGQYRLQLTATKSGAAGGFTTSGLAVSEAVAGQDAQILVGGAYTVDSASNTFTDVMPGLTFTVTKEGESANVDVAGDPQASADVVKGVVDAANAVLSEIDRLTAYDVKTRTGGPLAGDSLMRDLEQRVLSTIGFNGGGGSLGEIGVQVTREGRFSFDAEKFKTALQADPAKVDRILDASAQLSGASLLSATSTKDTAAGTYAVEVITAGTRATGAMAVAGILLGGESFAVALADGRSASYTAVAGDTAAQVAAGLQAAAQGAGLALTIAQNAGDATKIDVTSVEYGSAAKFTLTDPSGALSTHAGTDVVGTLGGATAVGKGNVLAITDPESDLFGLSVTTVGGATGSLGSVAITDGFAKAMAVVADRASERDGSVAKVIESRRSEIRSLDNAIAAWDQRLGLRRKALERQFSALEMNLGKMRNQSNWLAGQIAGLPSWQ